jgi:anaerobic ribonucleoside-triphosphate reductase activating protein
VDSLRNWAKDHLAVSAGGSGVTLYSGYTLEELLSRSDPVIAQILDLTDILIDGPYVKELSDNAGEYRGSTNQRIISLPLSTASKTCTE